MNTENFSGVKLTLNRVRSSLLLCVLCLFAISGLNACKMEPTNTNSATSEVAPSSSPSPSPSPAKTTAVSQLTLPILDALLRSEPFVSQLKTKIQLTDAQIEQLKQAASSEIGRLQTTNAEETGGDAKDARTRATEQISAIIGEQKTRDLTDLATEFWAKGGEEADSANSSQGTPSMSTTPNAIPTDTRVVINIPAFRMDLFHSGSLVKSYKIGIGYPQFPLPMGLRKAQTIIFNPTWTPPDSPWVANMKNVSPGEKVEAGSKLNPLGPIKIPIGMPSLIHGGKSPAKLGQFASHGCVGLTNAQVKDFAKLLAQAAGSDISDKDMASFLQDKTRTRAVKLRQTIPVELRYETIVVEDGKLHIFKDVYDQGTNTEENLRKVLEANGARFEDLSADEHDEVLNALNLMSSHPKKLEPASAPNANQNSNDNSGTKTSRKRSKAEATAKVTRNQKEIVIAVASLQSRGYPAPVELDTGTGKPVSEKTTANLGSNRANRPQ